MNIQKLAAVATALFCAAAARGAEYLVYAGTHTDGSSRGIYGYRFDPKGGKLKPLGLMATISNPTFLVEHPDHRFLYAVSEDAGNSISAFLLDPKSGKLALVNKVPSRGEGPRHLALDRSGRWLAVAHFESGSITVLPLREDGGLGAAQAVVHAEPDRGRPPHAQGLLFSPDNRFLLVADFGLDRIFVYKFDAERGSLKPADSPFVPVTPGAGVRHLVFHPNGRMLYALNEIRASVTAYRYEPANGALSEIQTVSTTPAANAGAGGAVEIGINAAGTVVYASNRGLNSMALLVVDPIRFTLSPLEFTPLVGSTPQHFTLDPTGAYMLVANQDSNNITVYTVHPHTGQLRPAGRPAGNIDKPACVVIVPAQ